VHIKKIASGSGNNPAQVNFNKKEAGLVPCYCQQQTHKNIESPKNCTRYTYVYNCVAEPVVATNNTICILVFSKQAKCSAQLNNHIHFVKHQISCVVHANATNDFISLYWCIIGTNPTCYRSSTNISII